MMSWDVKCFYPENATKYNATQIVLETIKFWWYINLPSYDEHNYIVLN